MSKKNFADLLFLSYYAIVESLRVSSTKLLSSLLGSNLSTRVFFRVEIQIRVLPVTTIATVMIIIQVFLYPLCVSICKKGRSNKSNITTYTNTIIYRVFYLYMS